MRHTIVVAVLAACFVLLGSAGVALAPGPPGPPDPPVSVFSKLDGNWKGVFVGYDTAGKELYRIRVEQSYETISETVQRVTLSDTMPDGTVIRGAGENTARRRPDGSLELKCTVRKSNGESVTHDGRLVKGPDDDEQLVWYSRSKDRTETFRESVRAEGPKTVYEINGMGRYGTTSMLMHGRYERR